MFDSENLHRQMIQQMTNHISNLLMQLFIGGADVTPALDHDKASESWQAAALRLSGYRDAVEIVCSVANGEDHPEAYLIHECAQSICEALFSQPGSYSYDIPPHFWQGGLGMAIRIAQMRQSGDEMITISQAAEILHPDLFAENPQAARMRVQRLIDNGELIRYIDPAETNPQHAGRVSRHAIEGLKSE